MKLSIDIPTKKSYYGWLKKIHFWLFQEFHVLDRTRTFSIDSIIFTFHIINWLIFSHYGTFQNVYNLKISRISPFGTIKELSNFLPCKNLYSLDHLGIFMFWTIPELLPSGQLWNVSCTNIFKQNLTGWGKKCSLFDDWANYVLATGQIMRMKKLWMMGHKTFLGDSVTC